MLKFNRKSDYTMAKVPKAPPKSATSRKNSRSERVMVFRWRYSLKKNTFISKKGNRCSKNTTKEVLRLYNCGVSKMPSTPTTWLKMPLPMLL